MSLKVIYDIGANNGDDIEYYAHKADLIVAVEANPLLARQIRERHSDLIQAKKLVVENCVITAGQTGIVDFYVHKTSNVQSQFPKPDVDSISNFNKVLVAARPIDDLVRANGYPYYVKVDIEHMDKDIVSALFSAGIIPQYLSAECHSLDVALLLSEHYSAFKIVSGLYVPYMYKSVKIKCLGQCEENFSFKKHSAGPFGDDIYGDWMGGAFFLRKLAIEGLGWVDVHCSKDDEPSLLYMPNWKFFLLAAKCFARNVFSVGLLRKSLTRVKLYEPIISLFL